MRIRKAKPTESKKIAEMWWDLAKEMEKFHDMNELGNKEDAIEETVKSYQSMILFEGYDVFIAEEDNTIIGYIDYELQNRPLMVNDQKLLIRQLYVKPQYRNNGVGSQLIETVIDEAESLNVDYIEIPTEWKNTKAHRIYKSKGFNKKQIRFVKTI